MVKNQNINLVFYIIFCEKLYFWIIGQNGNKVMPVINWQSEWQTGHTSNVNEFSIDTCFVTPRKCYFGWYKANKRNVIEWVSE